jgi:catechol 2,3-dioxygenase-like lactoylglutathione lyase family enzyme
VLFVTDLEPAVGFYTDVLGFEVIAEEPRANAAFLRARESNNHHDLGLFGLGERAERPRPGRVGFVAGGALAAIEGADTEAVGAPAVL